MTQSGMFEVDPTHFGRTARLYPLASGGQLTYTALITAMCAAMTEAGISVRKQVRMLYEMGFAIGQGGPGGIGSDLHLVCPYCGKTGNGGHGGNCPNGGMLPEDWVSPR